MAEWSKIRAEYIAGSMSYRELAAKHKVSFTTLSKIAGREKWVELRQQKEDKQTTKVVEALSEKGAQIDDKYYRLVDKLLDKAEATIDDIDEWHPTLLKEMATTMKYLKDCKGIKSDADMREQEARIKKLQMEAKDETPEDREVNVIFDGDIEKYSK